MSNAKHTPGPWRDETRADLPDHRIVVGEGSSYQLVAGLVVGEDNARLIAAAPELLEFTRQIAATKHMFATEKELLNGWIEAVKAARAVIAKATGDN